MNEQITLSHGQLLGIIQRVFPELYVHTPEQVVQVMNLLGERRPLRYDFEIARALGRAWDSDEIAREEVEEEIAAKAT